MMNKGSLNHAELSAQKAALLASILDAEGIQTEQERRIARRENLDAYPVSAGQQRMWILDQLENGPHYNQDFNLRLKGKIDIAVLERVFQEILRRHEATRSAFALVDGQLVQRIVPIHTLELPLIDLKAIPEPSRETEAMRIAVEEARKPFDLSNGPLWRFLLLSLAEDHHILLITFHHIAVDGWSWGVFGKEFCILYESFQAGKPSPLSEPAIQFSDYAAWQADWLKSEVASEQRSYWMQRLGGAPPLLELPTDRPRPSIQTFDGARVPLTLPKPLSTELRTLSAREGVTLFMTLLAAFDTLINRYTGKDDIVIGAPMANRTQPETEGLIGFFSNTLVLRNDLSADPTFRELLQRVRHSTLGALANQNLPFEQVVDALNPERTESYTPLFQVLLVFQTPSPTLELPGLSASPFEIDNGTSKVDLSLYVLEKPEGLSCTFEYNTDLFSADRVERMAGQLRILLEGIVRDPAQHVSELPIFTAEEQHRLLVEWNDTQVDYSADVGLHELFAVQAERTPEAVAVQCEGGQLTYGELNQRANQLAHYLATLGIGPDVLVGLYLERSLEMVVGVLGILKAGGAYVPLDPSFPQSRLGYMVEDSRIGVLLTHRGLEEKLQVRPPAIVRLDSDWQEIARMSAASAGLPPSERHNRAYVLYTSGSTGKPKGVEIPHSAIVNFLLSVQREPGFYATDTLLAVTTLSFDIASLEIYLPLISGGLVVIASREDTHDPGRLMQLMQESGCTVMQATPTTWRGLIQAGWSGAPNLRVLCGGEALLRDLAQELLPRCAELWNMYGPTETTVWSTVHRVASATGPVPIGKPIANTQLYVLNAQGTLVPPGVIGELYIGGDGLARGYLYHEELTRERFVPSPFVPGARLYRTGDLARWLPDGTMECLGRVDNQVKLRGFRIELGEIETLLSGHASIRQCAVVAREDRPGDKQLVAYFEAQVGTTPTVSELRGHLEKELPSYMVPAIFVAMEKLPLTPNGKIDRKSLPVPDRSVHGLSYVAPRSVIEKTLVGIWAEILGLERIGIYDNFFELGGHSLLAMQIISRIRGILRVDAPLRSLFEMPTVAGFAEYVEAIQWTSAEPSASAVALGTHCEEGEL